MGGTSSKTDATAATTSSGPTNIAKAVSEGNQLYIDKDVREKLTTVAKIMEARNKD
jgi:hypothetical protein